MSAFVLLSKALRIIKVSDIQYIAPKFELVERRYIQLPAATSEETIVAKELTVNATFYAHVATPSSPKSKVSKLPMEELLLGIGIVSEEFGASSLITSLPEKDRTKLENSIRFYTRHLAKEEMLRQHEQQRQQAVQAVGSPAADIPSLVDIGITQEEAEKQKARIARIGKVVSETRLEKTIAEIETEFDISLAPEIVTALQKISEELGADTGMASLLKSIDNSKDTAGFFETDVPQDADEDGAEAQVSDPVEEEEEE